MAERSFLETYPTFYYPNSKHFNMSPNTWYCLKNSRRNLEGEKIKKNMTKHFLTPSPEKIIIFKAVSVTVIF